MTSSSEAWVLDTYMATETWDVWADRLDSYLARDPLAGACAQIVFEVVGSA